MVRRPPSKNIPAQIPKTLRLPGGRRRRSRLPSAEINTPGQHPTTTRPPILRLYIKSVAGQYKTLC